jgi:hypothetical protein
MRYELTDFEWAMAPATCRSRRYRWPATDNPAGVGISKMASSTAAAGNSTQLLLIQLSREFNCEGRSMTPALQSPWSFLQEWWRPFTRFDAVDRLVVFGRDLSFDLDLLTFDKARRLVGLFGGRSTPSPGRRRRFENDLSTAHCLTPRRFNVTSGRRSGSTSGDRESFRQRSIR